MESVNASIPARSRLEAMDLSLVLISQGIESTIEHADQCGWSLTVSAPDYSPAVEAIRLYRQENRGRRWRREFLQPGLLFDWASFTWVVLVCVFYWLNSARIDLRTPGILDTTALAHGQWWRLFTAMWLHADLAHLAGNSTFGLLLLGLAMGRYGTGVALLSAYVAGAGGNVFGWLLSSGAHYGLGASGMVMGCLGLLAVQSVFIWRKTPHAERLFFAGLFAGLMLFVLLGLEPGTDMVAHFGGFSCGLLFGVVLSGFRKAILKPLANLVASLVFLILVLCPWWLALTHQRG